MVEAAGIEPEGIFFNPLIYSGFFNNPILLGRLWVVLLNFTELLRGPFYCRMIFNVLNEIVI